MIKYFLPSNLDLPKLVSENPPDFKPFKMAKLVHILDLINTIPLYNKDLLRQDFTPISAKRLQKYIQNYKAYFYYLMNDLKIIETNGHYLPGESCIGYRFIEKYNAVTIKDVDIKDNLFQRTTNRINKKFKQNDTKTKYLSKHFNNKLKINFEMAGKFLAEELHLKQNNFDLWDYDIKNKKFINPVKQYNHALMTAKRLAENDFYFHRDNNVYRFHSNLTNMRSVLRNAITYDGQKLVSIDICNSQPYLSILLLQSDFIIEKKAEFLSFNRKIAKQIIEEQTSKAANTTNIINNINIYIKKQQATSYIMLGEMPPSLINSGFQEYIDLVISGEFYERLADTFLDKLGMHFKSRKELKAVIFLVLFTDNRFLGQKDAVTKKAFKDLFPEVYEVFKQIKKHDKTVLPCLLQSIESYLMIDVIAKRIATEYPKAPIYTIHDSITTTEEFIEPVKRIMEEELAKAIGHAPKLKIEYWEPENMDKHLYGLRKGLEKVA